MELSKNPIMFIIVANSQISMMTLANNNPRYIGFLEIYKCHYGY